MSERIKNPCMVCKRQVTAKTGLQCQGSCKSWIHFSCCNYTPGKIKDIKAKVIKVRCPCPDCSTQGPKEVIMKDNNFTCVNKSCPMNMPPSCKKDKLNKMNQKPSPCTFSCKEWPGVACSGKVCSEHTQEECCPPPLAYPIPGPPPTPKCPPQVPAPCIPAPTYCPPPTCSPGAEPCPPPKPCPTMQNRTPPMYSPQPITPPRSNCPSPSPARRISPAATPVMPSISLVENMCETVGMLSDQLNQLISKMTTV
ncbi:keratinocyte proline-rich protein-like [Cydia splendana]|uniref:keratinocyte proline-rich protein-like n=1 Tax=Cydia splendana TaxID=1100963 RepID=UPI00300CB90B